MPRKRPGSVRFKPDRNLYEVRVSVGPPGNRQRRSFTSPGPQSKANEQAAYALLNRLLLQFGDGTGLEPTLPTLADWLQAYLETQTDLAPNTYDRKANHLAHIKAHAIGATRLDQLTEEDIEAFYRFLVATKGHKKGTLTKMHQFIAEGFRKAQRRFKRTLAHNPVALAELPRAQEAKSGQALPPEHQTRLLAAAKPHRLYCLIFVTLKCGLRRGEALGLRWPDVRLEPAHGAAGSITIERAVVPTQHRQINVGPTKTPDSAATIPIGRAVVEALIEHRERMRLEGQDIAHGWVFPSLQGTPVQPRNFNRLYDSLLVQAGLYRVEKQTIDGKEVEVKEPLYRLHDLRATSETEMIRATGNPKLVARYHRQKSVVTAVKHYQMVSEADLALAAALGDKGTAGDSNAKTPAE